jgi:hypothetical protein
MKPEGLFTLKMREIPLDQAPGQLDLTLSPDIIKNNAVAVVDSSSGKAGRIDLDDRLQGFVFLALLVGFSDGTGKSCPLKRRRGVLNNPS